MKHDLLSIAWANPHSLLLLSCYNTRILNQYMFVEKIGFSNRISGTRVFGID